ALLKKFAGAGGMVIFAGQPDAVSGPAPAYVDGAASRECADFAQDCYKAMGSAAKLVKAAEMSGRRVSIVDENGHQIAPCLYQLREDKDAFYLYVCNTGQKDFGRTEGDSPVKDRTATFPYVCIDVFAEGKGQPLEVCPDTGNITAVGKSTAVGWTIETCLPRLGSRLLVLPKMKASGTFAAPRKLRDISRKKVNPARWAIQPSEDNVIVLDMPAWRIGSGKWQKPVEILKIDDAVRESLGVQKRGGRMTQPWARPPVKNPRSTTVTLRYSFEADALPSGPMCLAIEMPQTFSADINGSQLNMDADCGWWVDKSLRRIPLDLSAIRLGTNVVTLICSYSEVHPGLEMVYLLGRFGAKVSGTRVTMTKMPDTLRLGDYGRQGLAFYSGNLTYATKIRTQPRKGERLIVQVPKFEGTGVRVLVDGKPAGIIAWEPREVDITDFVTCDSATLGIEVIGHRRNSHGPLHTLPKEIFWFGPGEFRAKPFDRKVVYTKRQCYWSDDYVTVPVGLMQPPTLVTRK
ncbi:MAG TPA: hypothetical protein VLH60_06675, partial [Sedimentisphaerales bacterium]|nr:hypothetical protein [Sedimentisphaerales bacterium]